MVSSSLVLDLLVQALPKASALRRLHRVENLDSDFASVLTLLLTNGSARWAALTSLGLRDRLETVHAKTIEVAERCVVASSKLKKISSGKRLLRHICPSAAATSWDGRARAHCSTTSADKTVKR